MTLKNFLSFMERKRFSKNPLWIISLFGKDFFWVLFNDSSSIFHFITLGYKLKVIKSDSFLGALIGFFDLLGFSPSLYSIYNYSAISSVIIIIPKFSGIHGELDALESYFSKYVPHYGDFVIDAGAYNGLDTILFSLLVGDSGKVISFEPNIKNFLELKKNVECYGLKNVILINKCLFSKNKTVRIFGERFSSSLFFKNAQSSLVDAVSLDFELKKLGIKKINFIKMDIEGSELEAIKGAKSVLKNPDIRLAIASYHIVNNKMTYLALEKILKKKSFSTETGSKHLTTWAWREK